MVKTEMVAGRKEQECSLHTCLLPTAMFQIGSTFCLTYHRLAHRGTSYTLNIHLIIRIILYNTGTLENYYALLRRTRRLSLIICVVLVLFMYLLRKHLAFVREQLEEGVLCNLDGLSQVKRLRWTPAAANVTWRETLGDDDKGDLEQQVRANTRKPGVREPQEANSQGMLTSGSCGCSEYSWK